MKTIVPLSKRPKIRDFIIKHQVKLNELGFDTIAYFINPFPIQHMEIFDYYDKEEMDRYECGHLFSFNHFPQRPMKPPVLQTKVYWY